jgi:hypothetical protein
MLSKGSVRRARAARRMLSKGSVRRARAASSALN